MKSVALLLVLIVAGCANGPMYWTKPGATEATFAGDHQPCFQAAYVGYGAGNEQAYKGCMRDKGWTRVQGIGSQPPSVPYFRGPEGDDEFQVIGKDRYDPVGRTNESAGSAALCDRPAGGRPVGTRCP